MRKSQHWQTIRTKRKNATVFDLVTRTEDTMASQTSEWTVTTQNRTKIRTATTNQDLDDYDDVITQELDSLFITPEEEQAIRNILELARKGKINSSNAFDLPVKVISPQASDHSNMRFWKFASQLLQTSMNIYDKRVENVFLSSNHMAHSLTRAHRSNEEELSDEQLRLKSKKKKRQLMQIDIHDLCQSGTISSYEIKHIHTEEPSRISMKEQKIMLLKDPFFNRLHQAFDSNSLARLFLNCLETGKYLQLSFITQKPLLQTPKETNLQESIDITPQTNEDIVDLYRKQLKKLTFICENRALFSEISQFRQKNLGKKEQEYYQVQRFFQLFDIYGQGLAAQFRSYHQRQEADRQILMNSNEMDPVQLLHDIKPDASQSSLDATLNDEQTPYWSNQLPCSEARSNQTLLDRQQCHTVMTPWELEFKGMKLQKRKLNQTTRSRTMKAKVLDNSYEIQFNPQSNQCRKQILKLKIEDEIICKQTTLQRFLLPKLMNPVAEILKKRTKNQISSFPVNNSYPLPQKTSSLEQLQLKMEHPFDKSEKNTTTNNNTYLPSQERQEQCQDSIELPDDSTPSVDFLPYSNVSSECIRNLKTFGLRSIRQMKYLIYEQIVKNGSICMSDLNLMLSPAGILIIFLHLVNQKNLRLTSIENEADVRITL